MTDKVTYNKAKKIQYKRPNQIEIPTEIREYFLKKGMKLRWIRYKIGEEIDTSNLNYKTSEGYSLVRLDEIPEDLLKKFVNNTVTDAVFGSMMVRGDLTLAKIPVEAAEARREFYREEAARLNDSIKHNVQKGGVEYSVKTRVALGRRANFAED
jgi:hypothetical protein